MVSNGSGRQIVCRNKYKYCKYIYPTCESVCYKNTNTANTNTANTHIRHVNQLVQHLWSSKYVQHWMLHISHSIIGTKTLPAGILKDGHHIYICTYIQRIKALKRRQMSPKRVLILSDTFLRISIAIIPPEHLNLTLVCCWAAVICDSKNGAKTEFSEPNSSPPIKSSWLLSLNYCYCCYF